MTPDRWQRIENLYHGARARKPESRSAFLAEACAGDAALRMEIESLLRHAPPSDEHLEADPDDGPLLEPGSLLGHYRVDEHLGSGGMGQVFRGLDTRLNRPVAIKVSRQAFSLRFRREALALSALNHPHICTLYDVGAAFLVMELVEGETLESRLRRGPLAMADVFRLGAQIASALAEAHARGIVHRDLKPGNIMLGRNGVKVLDFGLAAMAGDGDRITQVGLVVGTPAYLAPEQREGGAVGPPADIYAFGVVLHEMATNRRPAWRDEHLTGLNTVPATLGHVLERCLAEDPVSRWQNAAEIRALLEWSTLARMSPAIAPSRWRRIALALGAAAIVAGVAWLWPRAAVPATRPLAASIAPPPGTSFRVAENFEGGFALSPDGTMLAFIGYTDGQARLWIRRLDSLDARALPGTERAYFPFWSPDSKSVAFFTTAPPELRRIDVAGGAPVTIAATRPNVAGGAWGADGTLILGDRGGAALLRVSASGGEPKPVGDGINGRYPHFLPGAKRFIYVEPDPGTTQPQPTSTGVLMMHALDATGPPVRLGPTGVWPQFSRDHVIWFAEGHLVAQPFDPDTATLSGEPFAIATIAHRVFLGTVLASFSAGRDGTLVYPGIDHVRERLAWRRRSGQIVRESEGADDFSAPNISPDGSHFAVARRDLGNTDIWREELSDLSTSRLTFDAAIDDYPVWLPRGADLLFTTKAPDRSNLFQLVDGEKRRLTTSPYDQQALDWSADGRHFLYTQIRLSSEIMIGSAAGGEPISFLGHASGAAAAQFSPQTARWIAYDFDDSGRREIYVQGFTPGKPASSARWQVSINGGRFPRWRGDGRELYFLALDGAMMAVPVDGSGPSFRSSAPVELFRTVMPPLRTAEFNYDVTPDGQQFVIIEPASDRRTLPLTLLTDWRAALTR